MDKRLSLAEAVQSVPSGCLLGLGGMTLYRRPIAFIRALIQHFRATGSPNALQLLAFTAGLESDLLVGAGMVRQVRTCYFGLEIFGLAPMFTYRTGQGQIKILEETEASLAFGLRAQAGGVGFMAGRGWLGTDLLRLRPDVKTILDPYSGEELVAFPAIQPDVAVIHALQADYEGNALIGKNKGIDEELALTSKIVLITAEEIVPALQQVDIISPLVTAVIHCPLGALPTSCHPLYGLQGEQLMAYTDQVSDQDSFDLFLQSFLSPPA